MSRPIRLELENSTMLEVSPGRFSLTLTGRKWIRKRDRRSARGLKISPVNVKLTYSRSGDDN